ncbi:hypothetical protein HanIR_Chr04g0190521 [Helianthus annuus]|nr:hypothetical protein HanIR_Chr04g0190521 [Helianthus annuus]
MLGSGQQPWVGSAAQSTDQPSLFLVSGLVRLRYRGRVGCRWLRFTRFGSRFRLECSLGSDSMFGSLLQSTPVNCGQTQSTPFRNRKRNHL